MKNREHELAEALGGIDLEALLDAIAEVESSGGRNNWPRVEPAWLPRGAVFTIQGRMIVGRGTSWNAIVEKRWARWGLASAASWSPWQILYHTAADLGFSDAPHALHDPAIARPFVLERLALIVRRGARDVEEIADAWNSGTHRDDFRPVGYIEKLSGAYARLWKGPGGVRHA